MHLPVWAIILLGIGWLGFLWLLIKRDRGSDLTQAPRTVAPRVALPPLPGPEGIPPEMVAELRAMVANGRKLEAIKRLRQLTHCGLAEAKEWVERL
jgi:hypothetical protein